MSEDKKQKETKPEEINMTALGTLPCTAKFEVYRSWMEMDSFDGHMFRHRDGKTKISGASLRDVQTGCEIWERLGWKTEDRLRPWCS